MVSVILTAVLLMAGGFLGFYALFHLPSQHALMNVEGIVALSFLALLYARSGALRSPDPTRFDALHPALALAAIAVVVSLAFTPILRSPFLYDDYRHITDASQFNWSVAARQFGAVDGRGLFFRPFGFFLYWLNYLWARANPVWWHVSSVLLHLACIFVTYVLCRELRLSRPASLAGALLVGLNGVSAETVAWIDARFDLMTTLLMLSSLIFVCRYAATARLGWLAGALAAGACAILSKESGFCLPFLVASLALFRDREDWNRIFQAAGSAGVLAVALFAYRWWALGGIGGYADAAGEASILHFNVLHTLDALFVREWAVLFFPFNWFAPSSPILRAALAATPWLLAACAWKATPARRPFLGGLLFVVAAGLPVQHLLLLSPALSGSRALYLGSVGWALLWAVVFDSMAPRPRIVVACLLLLLQASILEHNLTVWRATADLAQSVCADFGRIAAGVQGPIIVGGLPDTRMGAVFLKNGFPQCVEMNSGIPADRIGVRDRGAANFIWSDAHARIEKAN
jgi:hypothetical protein